MRHFNSILVDSNEKARMLLKTAAQAIPEFGEVIGTTTTKNALSTIRSRENIDIVFVSSKLEQEDVADFVKEARKVVEGTAFVSVIKGEGVTEALLAAQLAAGINGFLYEPFSTDRLREAMRLAVSLKTESTAASIKKALALVVYGLARSEKDTAEGKKQSRSEKAQYENLLDTCRNLKELTTYSGMSYEAMISDFFLDLSTNALQGSYSGPSRRLQAQFEVMRQAQEKLRADLLALK